MLRTPVFNPVLVSLAQAMAVDDVVFAKIREEVALWKAREVMRQEKQSGATASTRPRTAYTRTLPALHRTSPSTHLRSGVPTRTVLSETELPWLPEMADTFAASAAMLAGSPHARPAHADDCPPALLGWPEGPARRQVLLDTAAALAEGRAAIWTADAAAQASALFSRILEEAIDIGADVRLDPLAETAERALLRTVLMFASEPEAGCHVWPVCEGTVAMLAHRVLHQKSPPPADWPSDRRAWTKWVEAVASAWDRVWPGYADAAWLSVLQHTCPASSACPLPPPR